MNFKVLLGIVLIIILTACTSAKQTVVSDEVIFYVKAENTRDFSRGMNWLIFLKSDTKFIANIRSIC